MSDFMTYMPIDFCILFQKNQNKQDFGVSNFIYFWNLPLLQKGGKKGVQCIKFDDLNKKADDEMKLVNIVNP